MTLQELVVSLLRHASIAADLLGIVAFGITIASYLKIRTVAKAQSEERKLLRSLYNTDTISRQLRQAATLLSRGGDSRSLTLLRK